MNDAFFEYAGSELAVIEITAGLRQLDEEKGFSASFVDNYGYPVWNESKIIPIDSEEALVVLPVKSRHENKIPALWIFLAHDNVVSNVVLTKEMAGNSGMDWEWGFDYFTQKMYPETSSSKYHFHELDEVEAERQGQVHSGKHQRNVLAVLVRSAMESWRNIKEL